MSGKKITGLVILVVGVLTFLFPIISPDTFSYSRTDGIKIFLYIVGVVLAIMGIFIFDYSKNQSVTNINGQNKDKIKPKLTKKQIILFIITLIVSIILSNIIIGYDEIKDAISSKKSIQNINPLEQSSLSNSEWQGVNALRQKINITFKETGFTISISKTRFSINVGNGCSGYYSINDDTISFYDILPFQGSFEGSLIGSVLTIGGNSIYTGQYRRIK
jgi:hypothetical protein